MYEHTVTMVDAKESEDTVYLSYRTTEGEDAHITLPFEAVGAIEVYLDQKRRKDIRDRREDLEKLTSRLKSGRRVYRLE